LDDLISANYSERNHQTPLTPQHINWFVEQNGDQISCKNNYFKEIFLLIDRRAKNFNTFIISKLSLFSSYKRQDNLLYKTINFLIKDTNLLICAKILHTFAT
jgi:hypothetical protein